jgi:hypothetical protein
MRATYTARIILLDFIIVIMAKRINYETLLYITMSISGRKKDRQKKVRMVISRRGRSMKGK